MTTNAVQQTGRIKSIDVAKFLGLLLVCYCHVPLNDGYFNTWAYSFHMPLFFFASGLFLKPDKFSLKQTSFRLLLPFCIFNLVLWIFDFIYISFRINIWSFSNLHVDWIFSSMYPSEASWFLIALFIITVCTAVSVKIMGLILTTCLIILLCCIYVFFSDYVIWQYFHLNSVIIAWPFYILGYIWRYNNLDFNIICRLKGELTLLLCVITFFSVFNEKVNIWDGCYGNSFLMYIILGDDYNVLQKVLVTCLTFALSYPIIKLLLCFFPESLGKKRNLK